MVFGLHVTWDSGLTEYDIKEFAFKSLLVFLVCFFSMYFTLIRKTLISITTFSHSAMGEKLLLKNIKIKKLKPYFYGKAIK